MFRNDFNPAYWSSNRLDFWRSRVNCAHLGGLTAPLAFGGGDGKALSGPVFIGGAGEALGDTGTLVANDACHSSFNNVGAAKPSLASEGRLDFGNPISGGFGSSRLFFISRLRFAQS